MSEVALDVIRPPRCRSVYRSLTQVLSASSPVAAISGSRRSDLQRSSSLARVAMGARSP